MKDRSLIWSARLTGYVATFFLAIALCQTALIIVVMTSGQRLDINGIGNDITGLDTHHSTWPFSSWTIDVTYQYEVSGQKYSAQVNVKANPIDLPAGNVTPGPPIAEWSDHFQVMVWDKLPQFPIPLLEGYHPSAETIPVWIMAVIAIVVYLCLHKLAVQSTPK